MDDATLKSDIMSGNVSNVFQTQYTLVGDLGLDSVVFYQNFLIRIYILMIFL